MAALRLSLAAEQGDPMIGDSSDQSRYRLLKSRLFGHGAVKRMALGVVVLGAGWTTTELLAEEEVPGSPISQAALELVLVELRSESRVRERTDVHHNLDLLRPQEADERVEIVIRMTDGPHNWHPRHANKVSQFNG
jgi:hypothetical protein